MGIVFIVVGLIVSIFSSPLSKGYIAFQNQQFGFKFGQREVKIGKLINIVVGMIFIIFGLLILANVIDQK